MQWQQSFISPSKCRGADAARHDAKNAYTGRQRTQKPAGHFSLLRFAPDRNEEEWTTVTLIIQRFSYVYAIISPQARRAALLHFA